MAGAYSTGGVTVTDEFKDFIRNSGAIKPIYPATTVSDDQIKIALAGSGENIEAIPQMALRTRTNVQQLRTPNAQLATEGLDFVSMLGDLTDDRWMDPLIKTNLGTSFFNLAPEGQRTLEAKITYNNDEGLVQGLRNDLRSYGMLGLTFRMRSNEGDPSMVRSPSYTETRKGYGRGYSFIFEPAIAHYTTLYAANPMPHAQNPDNILTSITEVDLRNPSASSGATWSCPQGRRYMIVKSTDAATYCPTDSYSYFLAGYGATAATGSTPAVPGMSAADYRREYEIARRHLKPEHWDISVRFRCAVPKEGNCYPNEILNGVAVPIEYDQRQVCFQGLPDIPYGTPIPTKRCAQYVSICNRN